MGDPWLYILHREAAKNAEDRTCSGRNEYLHPFRHTGGCLLHVDRPQAQLAEGLQTCQPLYETAWVAALKCPTQFRWRVRDLPAAIRNAFGSAPRKSASKWPCIPGRTRYGEYSTTLSSSVTPIADVCDYKDSLTVSWNSIDFPGSGFW